MKKEIKKSEVKKKRKPSKYQEVFTTDLSFDQILTLAGSGVGMEKDGRKPKSK